jgi:hypothetical protein
MITLIIGLFNLILIQNMPGYLAMLLLSNSHYTTTSHYGNQSYG